jgi:2-desacetyl-2-hydroxyethyl bacteriochlorophyllide A dehydrogenase
MKAKQLLVSDLWKVGLSETEYDVKTVNSYEVIVKTLFSHLSAGTEMACLSGLESWFTIPNVPGYTSIGEVIAKGDKVEKVNIGDIVFVYGTHSQYFKLDITERFHGVCVPIPANVNLEHAAFTHMAGIAMTSIRSSNIELGDYVLVTGQGAIGNLAAQLALLQGAEVIVTDIDDFRLGLSKKCGIVHCINSSNTDIADKVNNITNGKGVTTLIDASGISAVVAQAADCVALNGEIILLGSPRAPFETNLTSFIKHFHYFPFNHQLKGALEFTYPTQTNDFNKHSIERNAEIILKLIGSGKLLIEPLYTHKISPNLAQQAYEGLRDKKDQYIGVVFDWTNI